MTLLLVAVAWVLASTVVALLPMQRQYAPGIVLLIAAPVIIIWMGIAVAWWAGLLGLMAFLSMYRNPLRHIAKLLRARLFPNSEEPS